MVREGRPDVPSSGEVGTWAGVGEQGRLGEQGALSRDTMEWICGGEASRK